MLLSEDRQNARGYAMSLFFNSPARKRDHAAAKFLPSSEPEVVSDDRVYSELISQRPALLDEKLKLHQRIIDEFNLAFLDKMPREDLMQTVLAYVGDYLRTEKIS